MPRPSYGAPEVDLHSGRSYFVAGRFFVAVGGQPIEDHWRLRKAKTLVSCSPSRPGIGYNRDIVIDTLWPDAEAEAGLHQFASGPTRHSTRAGRRIHRTPCRINNTAWREAGGARRPGSRPLLPRAAGVHATPRRAFAPGADRGARGLGRRWEAIESYERLRDALEEEYAAELEPETKVLYRRLLSGNKPMPASTPRNLPESTTSFVGRQRLLTELTAGLVRTRLLTLTGVGSVRKSRLASHTFRTGCPHCRSRRRHRVNAMAAHAQF